MDSVNDSNNTENLKQDFIELLKKYHENLSNKNQELKSDLEESNVRNEQLLKEIEKQTENSLTPLTTSVDIMPRKTQTLIETCMQSFRNKTEQLQNVNETINSKYEEETKRCQEAFYEMITKDEVALKPYHDVEGATKELQEQIEIILKKSNEEKEEFLELLKKREQDFIQLKKDIADLEPIEKEMRFEIQTEKTKLDEKIKSLNLKSTAEATSESFESNELLKEISNLKAQLNID